MKRKVHLYGHLRKKFGKVYEFDVATAAEAMRALNCAFPGKFVEALKIGSYRVVRGDRHTGMALDLDLVTQFKLGMADLHLIPVAKGAASSKGGTLKVVLGVALVGAAIFFSGGTMAAPLAMMGNAIPGALGMTWGNIAMIGLGLTIAGAASMLAKPENTDKKDTAKDNSFSFSGPVNVNEQGSAVPVIIGEVICGSQPVSAGADVEDIGAYTDVVPIETDQTPDQPEVGGGDDPSVPPGEGDPPAGGGE